MVLKYMYVVLHDRDLPQWFYLFHTNGEPFTTDRDPRRCPYCGLPMKRVDAPAHYLEHAASSQTGNFFMSFSSALPRKKTYIKLCDFPNQPSRITCTLSAANTRRCLNKSTNTDSNTNWKSKCNDNTCHKSGSGKKLSPSLHCSTNNHLTRSTWHVT